MGGRLGAREDGGVEHLAPENVPSVGVWLGSEERALVTEKIIGAEGGRLAIADGWRSTEGEDKQARWSPDEIGAVMDRLLASEVPAQKVWGS